MGAKKSAPYDFLSHQIEFSGTDLVAGESCSGEGGSTQTYTEHGCWGSVRAGRILGADFGALRFSLDQRQHQEKVDQPLQQPHYAQGSDRAVQQLQALANSAQFLGRGRSVR